MSALLTDMDEAANPPEVHSAGSDEKKADEHGFVAVSEPTPFDDAEGDPFLQALKADIEEQENAQTQDAEPGQMTIEQAKKMICFFGVHMNKTLGEVFEDEDIERGRKTLNWLANRYKGDDTAIIEAARILLAEFDAIHGQMAA